MNKGSKGFTLIETLIAIAIIVILLAISIISISSYRDAKVVQTTANEIAFKLEEAKANSIAGKNSSAFGIHFTNNSYTYFQGNSYNLSDPNNITPSFPENYSISTNLTGGATDIVFARLTGKPNIYGSITVQKDNSASTTKTISIGVLGDISVVQ